MKIKDRKNCNSNKMFTEKHILKAVNDSKGFVSVIAKRLKCNMSTVHRWKVKSKAVREAIQEEREKEIDFAEGQLHLLMTEKSPAAIIFFLKTQGKARGYVEKQEFDHTFAIPETVNCYTYEKGEKVSTNGLASNGTVSEDD